MINNEINKSQINLSLYRYRSIINSMEYSEIDFLGCAAEIDPNFIKLYEEITGHKINIKKKVQDKSYLNCE